MGLSMELHPNIERHVRAGHLAGLPDGPRPSSVGQCAGLFTKRINPRRVKDTIATFGRYRL